VVSVRVGFDAYIRSSFNQSFARTAKRTQYNLYNGIYILVHVQVMSTWQHVLR